MVELGQLQESSEQFDKQGVSVIAVSAYPATMAQKSKEKSGASFQFLCDTEFELIDALGIRHQGGRFGKDIALPTLVLADGEGIIRWIYQPETLLVRARPEEVLSQMSALP